MRARCTTAASACCWGTQHGFTSLFVHRPEADKPSYNDTQIVGTFAGPLRIACCRAGPTCFSAIRERRPQREYAVGAVPDRAGTNRRFLQTRDHSAGRSADGSHDRTAVCRQRDPGRPISPQAAALLTYYPLPNIEPAGTSTTRRRARDQARSAQSRLRRPCPAAEPAVWHLISAHDDDAANLFGFEDSTRASGLDTTINWSHRFSQFLTMRLAISSPG